MVEAVNSATAFEVADHLGLNPGGEVWAFDLRDERLPDRLCFRFLSAGDVAEGQRMLFP